ncbi:50S ribosomal protein L17 [sediment metagenome]|uniref:50S ribosomal protein L17 n=1 Tax=sediment metagenome TaxID=749907 RepID=D9PK61_9ZZZZ
MRHHNANRKFGRERNQRRALLRSLAIALIKNEKIETTEAKAKEIRKYVEKLITKGKKGDLATKRLLISKLGSGGAYVVDHIFELAKKYIDRPGGYTRITKKGDRIGSDGAPMAIVEFIN